jgi:hypothetical protein
MYQTWQKSNLNIRNKYGADLVSNNHLVVTKNQLYIAAIKKNDMCGGIKCEEIR